MKSEKEIQRAHDVLIGVILREAKVEASEGDKQRLVACCNVLCWVLEHEHNPGFAKLLGEVERAIYAAGYRLEVNPERGERRQ